MNLLDVLKRQIATTGPMTVAEYMTICLTHEEHGYYTTRDPLGSVGDFTTAPEISQMFGELIGLALAQAWIDQGQPNPIVVAELGPGRGTLMADALRATTNIPGFHDALSVHFVELSPTLRGLQREAVPDANFHDTAAELPNAPLFLIANEFFDALPIRQFVRERDGWRERMVGFKDDLHFGLSPQTDTEGLSDRLSETSAGDVVELCPSLPFIIETISQQIETKGGAALIVDYGDWASLGDTLQAVKDHSFVDPLTSAGEADLSAHVDFAAIAQAATCAHTRLTPQGVFLERLGITARAQALARSMSGERLESHITAHKRLTHPDEMGNLFKVIGLYPTDANPPPGLNP